MCALASPWKPKSAAQMVQAHLSPVHPVGYKEPVGGHSSLDPTTLPSQALVSQIQFLHLPVTV